MQSVEQATQIGQELSHFIANNRLEFLFMMFTSIGAGIVLLFVCLLAYHLIACFVEAVRASKEGK